MGHENGTEPAETEVEATEQDTTEAEAAPAADGDEGTGPDLGE